MYSIASEDNASCSPTPSHPYTSYITIVSCFASMIGSVLIILTFVLWKDFRTIGRSILVFLAITDFFAALGYMFGAAITLTWRENLLNQTLYGRMCVAQSFITSFFPISSFMWTLNLAIYVLAVLVLKKEGRAIWKLLVVFHLAAWGIPLLVCLLGVGFGEFGQGNVSSPLTSVDWCFIKYNGDKVKYFVFEAVCGKFWEIITYVASLVIYIIIKRKAKLTDINAIPQAKYWSTVLVHRMTVAASEFDRKLIWIPLIFILFRMWGTLRFFLSFGCNFDCIRSCAADNIGLMVMQSIFDPAQGWGNALLFVVFHKPTVSRMCPCVLKVYDTLCMLCSCCKRDGLDSPLLGSGKQTHGDNSLLLGSSKRAHDGNSVNKN